MLFLIGFNRCFNKYYSCFFKKYWPNGKSEGLLNENNKYYRVFADGKKEEI